MTPSCWSSSRPRPTSPPECGAAFDPSVVYTGTGRTDLMLEGPEAALTPFLRESGGHRWQRVPPTERSGRVHSSTVTVVALLLRPPPRLEVRDADLEIETMRGQGAGGQHRNKTESAVRMRHRPTGIEVRICMERSQHRNRELARELLEARVFAAARATAADASAAERRALAGTGERADKIRTARCRENVVIDHRSGERVRLDDFMRGILPR